jgi:NAD(P)-dependent dehydrogenase (short-subunit alcohol dehydrogenase family)
MQPPRVVLVTGASSGFGQAIARTLAARGQRVYGTSRRPAGDDGAVRMLALDVNDDASVARCVAAVLAAEQRIDVLVSNAGVGLCGAVEDSGIDEIRWQLETNFIGAVRVLRAVLPAMRAQRSGRLITIGSLGGLTGMPYQPFYSASKFALEGLTEALRLELAGSGIDATIVEPGDFRTGFTDARVFARAARSPAHRERLERVVAIYERDERNGADPQRVGELVAKLVEARRLRVRYSVGRWDQRAALFAKRLLPAAWFERLVASLYAIR